MRKSNGHVSCALGIAGLLCIAWAGTAHARTDSPDQGVPREKAPSATPRATDEAKRRETLFSIDDALPWDGYLKIGRFAPAWTIDGSDDWLSASSTAEPAEWQASPERTFLAAEAGKKTIGLGARVSAAAPAKSGELDMRFAATAYRRWRTFGPASDVVAAASASTTELSDRRLYEYTGASSFSFGSLSFVGHGAIVDRQLPSGSKRSVTAHAQARWLLAGYVDTRLGFEWIDPDHSRRGDERNRVSIGVEPSFRRVRARVCYRVSDGPRNRRADGGSELAFEIYAAF